MSSDRSVDNVKKEDPKLSRSLSVNSLIRSDSLSKLFNKNKRKRLREDDSDFDDTDTLTNESVAPSSKRSKLVSQVDKEFLANEKKLDDALPEEMRKFRPKGYSINLPPTDRPIRIYADGVFDLFHLGHMRQLEQCKKSFENVELVVGIPSDAVTHKLKGLTVLSDVQRYETLRHCKWVDEVIEDAPWILSLEFLQKHKIDYCAHDDLPYAAGGIDDIYKPMKEAGMFLVTQRTEGISTSDIITKIIRDYDKYLMRNFARGATRKELNVSWLKKNELDLKKQINDFRSYWKRTNTTLNNASRDLYFEVREMLRGNQLKRAKKNGRSLTRGGIPKSLFSSSSSSVSTLETPADKFASRYNGNGLGVTRSKRSLIDNFKEWVNGTDSHSEFESQNDDDDDDAFDDYDTSDEYQNDDGKGESKDVSEEDDAKDDSESEEYYEISPDPEQEHSENREEDKEEVKDSPLPKTRSTRGTKV